MTRILLGQLGANGDCLYTTILARQLRHDYPGAHITWAISSQCARLLRSNPHIDELWEIPIPDWEHHGPMWRLFEAEATRRLACREFDHVILSQIWPSNFQNFDGTIRPSILRSYGRPITVPIENVIEVTDEEIARVDRFAAEAGLASFDHRILFECSTKSGQSHMTPELAQEVAGHVYAALPSTTILFSTNLAMATLHPNSRYVGLLSLRECARLSHHCSLFVGAGSGGSVAQTSTAARRLPMIQVLARETSVFASFAHDFEHFGLDASHMLETTEETARGIADTIVAVCRDGIASARPRYERRAPLAFQHYMGLVDLCLLKRFRFLDAARSLTTTAERYGWRPELLEFGLQSIAPRLAADPAWVFAHRRREGVEFRDRLELVRRKLAVEPAKVATQGRSR